MTTFVGSKKSRRLLLQYLAASPLMGMTAKGLAADPEPDPDYAPLKGPRLSGQSQRAPDPMVWKPYDPTYLIKKPEDALDVFEFEPIAHKNVPGAHFGFLASGADDEVSLRAERTDFTKFSVRPRRLLDVRRVDPSLTAFGHTWSVPFYFCPIGSQKMYHPEGEVAVGRATGKRNMMQALSTYTSCSVEDVKSARGGLPLLYQLYHQSNFDVTKALVQRAERAGCPAVFVTVDSASARKDMTFERAKRDDTRLCSMCHDVANGNPKAPMVVPRKRAMFSEIPDEVWDEKFTPDALTWDFMKRLRGITKMKIYAKGIMSAEDAALCVKNGLDGVYISNHGARAEDTGASTISVLPDVVAAVKGKIPVIIDGGFRRGMDILKAIAMGATAVGVGRPYIWGLAAFGEPGVDKVADLLTAEFITAMQQVGATTLKDLKPGLVHSAL